MMQKQTPRGIRNNNPLNIRRGQRWQGLVKRPTDPHFDQFVAIEWGIRAAFIILKRYIQRYHLSTLERIIARWAPANENNTRAYIRTVAQRVGISSDTNIDYSNKKLMCSIADAMIQVECGQQVDMRDIERGYDMA